MDIQQQRYRAIEIITEHARYNEILPIDSVIDDECRRILNLPARPAANLPYSGWMKGVKPPKPKAGHISQQGIDLIKRWEGCRTNAYKCPAGVWTIGYGHTKTAKPHMMISHLEAERLLKQDLINFETAVRNYVKVPITQGQFDALVSFTYNVGISAFCNSTLLKYVNQNKFNTAALQFGRWIYAGDKKLAGLVRRRRAEKKLFES